jgi:hypothetical protein
MPRLPMNTLKNATAATVLSAPSRMVSSNAMTTYGGIEAIGLPPVISDQSSDIQIVMPNPAAQPVRPPISVKSRTALTDWSSASSIS